MIRYKKILTFSLVGLLFLGVGYKTADNFFEISKNMDIMGKLYTEVNKVYVDETNPTQLMRTGIEAMLASLDPYTNFYSESQIVESRVISTGQYSSIGAEIGKRGDKILILELYEDGPADREGLKVGDQVLKIDEEQVDGSNIGVADVINLLLGERDTEVELTIRRSTEEEPITVRLKRGGTETQKENVPFFSMANDEVGYILLTGFTQDAGKEVADALRKLQKDHPDLKSVILDLRGNPGGRLDEAVNVSNVFIPQGEKIVEMKGRTPESQNIFYTLRTPVDTEIPVAVLVNGRSASASEIVSGSIQDLDRGVVVGQRSFGKGLVQNVRPLSYNTQMKITIAKYYTPSGRCIQAIDYSSRNPDGSVGRVPDSLVTEFKTRNGRAVFDGGGVDPDIQVEKPKTQPVVKALTDQGLVFDFVTQFVGEHDSISGPRTFVIEDKVYQEFLAYVQQRGFDFETRTDQQIKTFEVSLEDGSYKEELDETLKALQSTFDELKQKDLEKYKPEISNLLKREIINRYFYKEGVLESLFVDDPDILAAIEILNDSDRYVKILSGEEKQ